MVFNHFLITFFNILNKIITNHFFQYVFDFLSYPFNRITINKKDIIDCFDNLFFKL
jgi:hypothetical protein